MSVENTAPQAETPQTVEEVLDEATSLPEEKQEAAPEAAPASKEEKKVVALQEKKESGEKLTKAEEKQLKEFKLKVNGREKSVKLDLSNEAELQKYLQKAVASDEAFQQAAMVQKAAQAFLDDLKKNPKRVLQDANIGVDIHKLAEEIMNERIAEMEKSPEQREKEALQSELKRIKEERESEKKSFEEKEFKRLQEQNERNLENDINAALDIGGLPKTPRTVASMAEMMSIAARYGIDLKPQDIAPLVKQMRESEFQEVLDSLGDDQLEDFIGKKVMGRLRKKAVAKAKVPSSVSAVKSTGAELAKKEEAKPAQKTTIRDWLKV